MPDTALAVAFTRAGIKSADERLTEIAITAMVEHADNTSDTIDAIWAEVQRDRALMVELFKYAWRREVGQVLQRTQTTISRKEAAGALRRPVERKAAEVIRLIRAEEARQQEKDAADEARSIAKYKAEQEREKQKWLARWRSTAIGSLTISDKPVWQCTPGAARAWLVVQRSRWRAVELLIEGLPDDGRPIEYYRKPEEVAALLASAACPDG